MPGAARLSTTMSTRHGPDPVSALSPGRGRLTRRTLAAASASVVVAAATGCGNGGSRPASTGVDKVAFLTTFGTQGRDCYAYVAAEKGFFAEAGIDVEIQPGKAGDYNHQVLASGKAQFATVDASGALVRYANGADTSFQILAAVHQSTLVSIIAMDGTGIAGPRDLEGKTLGSATGAVPQTLFPAYARLAGVEPDTVSWQSAAPEQLPGLLVAGKVHGVGLFIVGRPGVEAAAGGRKTVALAYSDFMSDLYGAVLVAPKKLITGNPDLTRRFTGALLKGLDFAVNNPREAGQILARRVPSQAASIAAAELELMKPYVTAAGEAVGRLDPARMARSVALLQSVGLVPDGSNPNVLIEIVNFDSVSKNS
jgi:NitT/TauT family transport system substrate-binding protein